MWMIYAMGGGWGHVTRAAALARVAPRAAKIYTNSPYAGLVRNVEFVSAVTDCDCLIVDTFPRGLLGELADWLPQQRVHKVLVARDLNPEYVESFGLRAFVADNYDLVLRPGEGEAFEGISTDPWLACPVPPVQTERRTAFVCASGNKEEQSWYGEVARLLSDVMPVRCLAASCPPGCPPELWEMHWPALELFGSAAVVVGGGGYNLVYETRAAGVPLVARAWPRLYDRQELRAQRAGVTLVTTAEQAKAAALRLRNCTRRPCVKNGAVRAAELIAGL